MGHLSISTMAVTTLRLPGLLLAIRVSKARVVESDGASACTNLVPASLEVHCMLARLCGGVV